MVSIKKRIMMTVERSKNNLIITIPSSNIKEAQDIMNFLKYKEIVKKSKAKKNDLAGLSLIAKKGRWERTRSKLGL